MLDSDSIIDVVDTTIKNLKSEIIDRLEQWGKTVLLTIDEEDYFINFKDIKTKSLIKGAVEEYDFKLSTNFQIFNQIMHNEINPVEAVVSGEVAIEGSLTDALEFSELITGTS